MWSYRSLESQWWRAADGLSLPLVRLYCKYLGGSIALVPMEGYGTDCYIAFNRLPHENCEQIRPAPSGVLAGGWDECSLFDAQSRRGYVA